MFLKKWFSLNQHQRSWILQKLTLVLFSLSLISDFQGTLRKLLNPRSAGVTTLPNRPSDEKNMRYGLQGDVTMVAKNTLSSRF